MRKKNRLIQIQPVNEEGETCTVLVDLDNVEFINVTTCGVVLKPTPGFEPLAFTITHDSMARLVDTLDRSKLVYGGVKL